MFSRLGVMQLGQTYLSFTNHLSIYIWKDLNKRPTILRGISWGVPARGSQSWFRRRRRGRNATSLGSTDAGLDSQWRVIKGLAPGPLEIECNDRQVLQLNADSATSYDCIMQFQCINTCERWPLLPSRQIFNFEFGCSSWGFEILVVSSDKYMQISCACIVGLIWVKYFQVDWKTWLETLITCFHWRIPCSELQVAWPGPKRPTHSTSEILAKALEAPEMTPFWWDFFSKMENIIKI